MSSLHRRSALALAGLFLFTLVLMRAGVFVALDHHWRPYWQLLGPYGQSAYPRLFSAAVTVLSPFGGLLCSLLLVMLWTPRSGWRRALLIPAGLVVLVVIEVICKELLRQPAGALPTDVVLGIGAKWSFPSGHAARACYLLLILAARLPRICSVLIAVVAIWLCKEMVSTGMHYASDVIGGVLLGGCVAVAVLGVLPPYARLPFRTMGRVTTLRTRSPV